MTELTEQEKEAMANDIAEAKKRIDEKEKSESLEELKKKAKEEALKEIQADKEAEDSKKEKEDLAKQLQSQKEEMAKKEEEYKKKLDAMIESQAVVQTTNPFADNRDSPQKDPIASLTEEQMDDIETASRKAFEEELQNRR